MSFFISSRTPFSFLIFRLSFCCIILLYHFFEAPLYFSYIGEVKVNIPLYALFARPITASIDTIVLVLETRPTNQWDSDQFRELFLKMKQGSLAAGETAAFLSSFEDGFLWRMGLRLAKNVRVTVKNVHIRFEDRIARRNRGMAMGKLS